MPAKQNLDALQKEITRVREILQTYKSIGLPGMYHAIYVSKLLSMATEALERIDIDAVRVSLRNLKSIKLTIY